MSILYVAIPLRYIRFFRYPVILSIENHASFENQRTMANHFRDIFGEKLYIREFTNDETDFPSPEELKYKILVKVSERFGKSL